MINHIKKGILCLTEEITTLSLNSSVLLVHWKETLIFSVYQPTMHTIRLNNREISVLFHLDESILYFLQASLHFTMSESLSVKTLWLLGRLNLGGDMLPYLPNLFFLTHLAGVNTVSPPYRWGLNLHLQLVESNPQKRNLQKQMASCTAHVLCKGLEHQQSLVSQRGSWNPSPQKPWLYTFMV